MQHLDEGTIHAWIDGALPPEEAARVETHVAECPECAAKVAEARGFIAASSRILTALDHVPRGVIPAAPTRPRINRTFLQAAAVLLVVATGSLLVLRARSSEKSPAPSASNTAGERVTVAEAPVSIATPTQSAAVPAPTTKPGASIDIHPNIALAPRSHTPAAVSGAAVSPGNAVVATTVAPSRATPAAASGIAGGSVVAPPLAAATVSSERRREASHDTTVNVVLSRDQVRLQQVVVTGVATVAGRSPEPSKIPISGTYAVTLCAGFGPCSPPDTTTPLAKGTIVILDREVSEYADTLRKLYRYSEGYSDSAFTHVQVCYGFRYVRLGSGRSGPYPSGFSDLVTLVGGDSVSFSLGQTSDAGYVATVAISNGRMTGTATGWPKIWEFARVDGHVVVRPLTKEERAAGAPPIDYLVGRRIGAPSVKTCLEAN